MKRVLDTYQNVAVKYVLVEEQERFQVYREVDDYEAKTFYSDDAVHFEYFADTCGRYLLIADGISSKKKAECIIEGLLAQSDLLLFSTTNELVRVPVFGTPAVLGTPGIGRGCRKSTFVVE